MHLIPLIIGIILVIVGICLIIAGKEDAELIASISGDDTNPNLGFAVGCFIVAFFLVVFSIRVWGEDCWIETPIGEGLSPECAELMDRR